MFLSHSVGGPGGGLIFLGAPFLGQEFTTPQHTMMLLHTRGLYEAGVPVAPHGLQPCFFRTEGNSETDRSSFYVVMSPSTISFSRVSDFH